MSSELLAALQSIATPLNLLLGLLFATGMALVTFGLLTWFLPDAPED